MKTSKLRIIGRMPVTREQEVCPRYNDMSDCCLSIWFGISIKQKLWSALSCDQHHYNDDIMSAMGSQITSFAIACSVSSGADKNTSKLRVTGIVRGIHRWPVNSPHKWPVTRKMFPFDDAIMITGAELRWHSSNMQCTDKKYLLWKKHKYPKKQRKKITNEENHFSKLEPDCFLPHNLCVCTFWYCCQLFEGIWSKQTMPWFPAEANYLNLSSLRLWSIEWGRWLSSSGPWLHLYCRYTYTCSHIYQIKGSILPPTSLIQL